MKLLCLLAVWLLACCVPVAATALLVSPGDFDSLDLDIDGDGLSEIFSFDTTSEPPNIRVLIRTDPPLESTVPEGTTFASESFGSLSALGADGIFTGTASLSSPRLGMSFDTGGYLVLQPATAPILAAWIWGTSGSQTTDPHYLTGFVVDATAYAANPAAPITIYYASYGAFAPGDARLVSLIDTMVPVPLPPDPGFTVDLDASGENLVLAFVAHEGWRFWIRRSFDLIDWSDYGAVIPGQGTEYQETIPITDRSQFFQLVAGKLVPGPRLLEIVNPGFEDPILRDGTDTGAIGRVRGWSTMAGSGAWNPLARHYPDEAPEGANIAFVQDGNQLTQVLDADLQPNVVYTLTAMVGKRLELGYPDGAAPDLYLRVNGQRLIPSNSPSSPIPSPGRFATWTREYMVDGRHPGIRSPLEIVLDGGSAVFRGGQVNFDSLTLSVE